MGAVYLRPTDVVRGDQTTAGRFAISRWGGPTTPKLTNATVGTSASRIVLNNPRRVKLLLLNLGAFDVYVGFDSSVTTTSGLKLVASTGTLESNAADDGEEVITELWAISGAAGQTVMISEVYRV
jgi:hypothetical protein